MGRQLPYIQYRQESPTLTVLRDLHAAQGPVLLPGPLLFNLSLTPILNLGNLVVGGSRD
jgi:hypothetical protein